MLGVAKAFLTALVVDDHADSRTVFRHLLEARGCAVAEAVDGEHAVQTARRLRPDLILLDLNMPRLDGLEAAQRIRELRSLRSRIPIIAITAFDTYGMREAALEAGCDDYLTKPIEIHELDRTLKNLLPLYF